MIVRLAERTLRTKYGGFHEFLYYDGQKESIALAMGDIANSSDVPCRIHSACLAAHAITVHATPDVVTLFDSPDILGVERKRDKYFRP